MPLPLRWLAFAAKGPTRDWLRRTFGNAFGPRGMTVIPTGEALITKARTSPEVGVFVHLDDDPEAAIDLVRKVSNSTVVVVSRRPSSQAGRQALSAGAAAIVQLPDGDGPEAVSLLVRRVGQALRQRRPQKTRVESATTETRPSVASRSRAVTPTPRTRASTPTEAPSVTRVRTGPRSDFGRPALCVVGISTGGPDALAQVLPALPATCPPIVVVQHMPAGFTADLAKRLDRLSAATVVEAKDGDPLQAGRVYIAPGGTHTVVTRGRTGLVISLHDGAPVGGHRPSASVLFDSVADLVGSRVVAAILTGIGDDGVDGMMKLRSFGARTLAQSPEGCAVYGMPKQAVERGAAQFSVPLAEMAQALMGR